MATRISLGGLYYRGNGVEQSYETAFDRYTRSANQSFPYASFELGKMLRDGIGCAKNKSDSDSRFAEAFSGFTALEQQSRDDKLQYRLGWMLLNGVGTENDEAAAKEYFEKAATVGNPFACYQLAKLILSDEAAPPQEVEKALVFLKQAVAAENPYARKVRKSLSTTARTPSSAASRPTARPPRFYPRQWAVARS